LGKAFLVLAGGNEMSILCMYVCMCWLSRQRVSLEEEEEDVGVWMELI
jgi:hypothetical protein